MPDPNASQLVANRASFARTLLAWYRRHRRDLPWRPPIGSDTAAVDPYRVLLSEFMLQQTQVATVVGYFNRFLEQLPTLADLAAAPEQQVLRLWQGLGYYSRARNLHAAAQKIAADLNGQIPSTVDDLTALPGIGRYTAGAIASIAFNQRAPILDGNVARVLCRLEKIQKNPRDPKTVAHLWSLAEQVLPSNKCGQFNSALMELGATICTPRQPKCNSCPVKNFCAARAADVQEKIPAPRKSRPIPTVHRWTICIEHDGHWLLHRRPPKGRWAGLWEFTTIPAEPNSDPLSAITQKLAGVSTTSRNAHGAAVGRHRDRQQINNPQNPKADFPRLHSLAPLGQIRHTLTHRRYIFSAYSATVASIPSQNAHGLRRAQSSRAAVGNRNNAEESQSPNFQNATWIRLDDLNNYPLSRPQLLIARLLQSPAETLFSHR